MKHSVVCRCGALLVAPLLHSLLQMACGRTTVAAVSRSQDSDAGGASSFPLPPVDKIDLVIDVDDSPRMGDKQAFLALALPELIARFAPITDIHIAVVSSSLGSRGGDLCDPAQGAHLDGQGEPRSISLDGRIAGAAVELGEDGCEIESPLESWYRFLIQPDPYDHIHVSGAGAGGQASWAGVDASIIAQRHAFLRPDSAVVILVLSDESDSEIDVRSLSGSGRDWMIGSFDPPRGTSACLAKPDDPSCMSCAFINGTDPSCAVNKGVFDQPNDWGFDPNLRHVHMRAKYGLDVQYPIQRYVDGLTQIRVPDRAGEYLGGGSYVGNANCANPLFASALPDGSDLSAAALCDLQPGFVRAPDRIFFAVIGGVPNPLLHFDPSSEASTALSPSDWNRIGGEDPEHFDTTGIDPHLTESYRPRPGLPPDTAANDADPITGREWITDSAGHVDLEYACIFPLPAPRDCSVPENAAGCACPSSKSNLPASAIPPVCDSAIPTLQVAAGAYPATRQLLLARNLGEQAIAGSICPIHVTEQSPGDPLFGYRPAMTTLFARMKPALGR